jgi:site-specific recombinase XerD
MENMMTPRKKFRRKKPKPQTVTGYKKTLKCTVPDLRKEEKFKDITIARFEQVTIGDSDSYKNNKLCAIKWLLRGRYQLDDSHHEILTYTFERRRRKVPKFLTEAEVMDALGKLDGRKRIDIRNRAMIAVSIAAGLRSSEVVGLRLSDIWWDHRVVYIESRKGGDEQIARLSPRVQKWIKAWIRARPSNGTDALFTAIYHGAPLTTDGLRAIHSKQFAKLFEKHTHPHMMRHSMVKAMRDRGASEDHIMAQGDWDDRATFKNHYDCLLVDQIPDEQLPFGG